MVRREVELTMGMLCLHADFNEHFTASPTRTTQVLTGQEEVLSSGRLSVASLPLNADSLTDIRHSSQLSLIAASANEIVSDDAVGHLDCEVGSPIPNKRAIG